MNIFDNRNTLFRHSFSDRTSKKTHTNSKLFTKNIYKRANCSEYLQVPCLKTVSVRNEAEGHIALPWGDLLGPPGLSTMSAALPSTGSLFDLVGLFGNRHREVATLCPGFWDVDCHIAQLAVSSIRKAV